MKNKILLAIISAFMVFNLKAQSIEKDDIKSIEKGDFIIDGYYSLINLYSVAYIPLFVVNSSSDMITNKSTGPIGIRIEHMETDKIGFGLDLAYNSSEVTYVNKDGFYTNPYASSGIDPSTGNNYINTYKTSKFGALLSFNFHFATTNRLDAYLTMGIGYGKRKIQESSTDPTIITSNRNAILPISEKLGIGIRYFFTPKIGANFALNVGQGGLLNVGLTMKL